MSSLLSRLMVGFIVGSLPLAGLGQTQLVQVSLPIDQVLVRRLIAPPADFVELCTELKRGRPLAWQFDAEHPVGFNTHFHVEGAIRYAEQMSAISAAKGRLVPAGDHGYCWMWTNSTRVPVVVLVQLHP